MKRTVARRGVLATLCGLALVTGLAAAPTFASPDDQPTGSHGQRAMSVGQPLAGWRIALDPGHNGGNAGDVEAINRLVSDGRDGLKTCNTTGTASLSGYPEHEFTYEVAVLLATRLERMGATVIMTREDDDGVGPCVDIRGRFAEDVDADLMVSIHANGSASSTAEGFFAIVADPAISPSQEAPSHELAEALLEALEHAGLPPSNTVPDALSERADLATLNFARRPAVMLELGEMRNPDDASRMESESGRQTYASAIAAGILAWADDNPHGAG